MEPSVLSTTLKSVHKFKRSLSIHDIEKTTSCEFLESEDLLHHKVNKLYHNKWCEYKTTSELYIERAELISIRDIMLHGKTQSVSRLLYYFWMDMDHTESHLKSLNSHFLQEWLRIKLKMVARDIPFLFETEHQESNLKHMTPGSRVPTSGTGNTSLQHIQYNVYGDNELIDRYGRFSAGSLMRINVEIATMDNRINTRNETHTKAIAFICSLIYLLGQIYFTVQLTP
jgi:hypothetical protein